MCIIPRAQIFRLDHSVVDAGNSNNSPEDDDDSTTGSRNHPDINMEGVSYKSFGDPCGLSTLLSCVLSSHVVFMRIPRDAKSVSLAPLLPPLPPSLLPKKQSNFCLLRVIFAHYCAKRFASTTTFCPVTHTLVLLGISQTDRSGYQAQEYLPVYDHLYQRDFETPSI